ncbi:MAG: DUF881 domain-containing protein [Clostridiaceae bacterium]|nr:DUF881 domain-containing protein [Bacillota bacterium]NLN51294.1 DUF881 domain-containing protein [Clostridiaceae bacterium]
MRIKNLIGKYGVVTIIAIILGIALALQIKTTNVSAYESRDIIELQNNVRSYAEKNAELNERNASLYEEIEKLREDQAKGDIYYEDILQEKEKMAIFAGLTAVQNSGIVINMGMTGQSMISDSYLRLIVNELNTLGAQAISINDQRKVATTEIRATSENIIINGVGYPRNEDFVIKAIINPDQQASAIITLETLKKSIQDREDADHQLDMSIAAEDKVIIPALSEDSIVYKTDLLRPVDDD